MFRALSLRPGSCVRVDLVRGPVRKGGLVKLRPLTFKHRDAEGDDGIETGKGEDFLKIQDHQSVLETELKHYSTITPGAVIGFVYNGRRYYFEVMETWTGGGREGGGGQLIVGGEEMEPFEEGDLQGGLLHMSID